MLHPKVSPVSWNPSWSPKRGVERLAGPGLKDSYLLSWHGLITFVSEGSYGCDFYGKPKGPNMLEALETDPFSWWPNNLLDKLFVGYCGLA